MRSLWDFIIKPSGSRYNNVKKIDEDKELIINSEISNHQFVNRTATVVEVPVAFDGEVKKGDEVIVHHNIFRRWYNVKGEEKNSRAFLHDNKYLAQADQVYLYKKNDTWKCFDGYCFVQPIKDKSMLSVDVEKPLMGIVKYSDGTVNVGDLVGFKPHSEFEFIIDGQRLYRVMSRFITIKYEYQGDEEEYNPSWAQSG
jgi:hypothetical protein